LTNPSSKSTNFEFSNSAKCQNVNNNNRIDHKYQSTNATNLSIKTRLYYYPVAVESLRSLKIDPFTLLDFVVVAQLD